MFVLPGNLAFREVCTFSRGWRRVGDLGDKVRCGCLGNAIHQHTNVWDPQKNRESEGKAEENTFSVAEPPTLLLGGELDAPEVGFELEIVNRIPEWRMVIGLTSSRIRLREAKYV